MYNRTQKSKYIERSFVPCCQPNTSDGAVDPSASRLQVTKLCTWAEVEQLRDSWERLAAAQRTPSVFLTWQWTSAWWKSYGGPSALYVLVVRGPDAEVAGIAPFYTVRKPARGPLSLRVLRFIGSNEDSGTLDILARQGEEASVWQAVLRYLQSAPGWDVLELTNIDAEASSRQILLQEFGNREWRALYFHALFSRVHLPPSWDEYISGLRRKRRYSMARADRKLEQEFAVVRRRCELLSEVPLFLDQLFKLHAQRWSVEGLSGAFDERRREFYLEVSRKMFERGWLDLWQLELSGRVVAVEFGFRYRGARYALQAGRDPEFSSYGVGQALEAFLIKHAMESGDRLYEFMAGSETYKARWQAETGSFVNFRCARAWSLGGLGLRMGGILKRNSRYRQGVHESKTD